MPVWLTFRQVVPRICVVIACGAALFGLAVSPFYLHRLKLQHDLAACRQELRSRGEKLTIEDLGINPSPAALQAGSNLISACAPLTNLSSTYGWDRIYGGVESNNHVFLRSTLPEFATGNEFIQWPELAQRLEKVAEAQPQIEQALRAGKPAFTVDCYTDEGKGIIIASPLFLAFQVFQKATFLHLHQGQFSRAHADVLDSLELLRCMEENALCEGPPVYLPYSFYASWELLQFDQLDDQQLSELQQAWQAQEFFDSAERCLAISRANLPSVMDRLRHPKWEDDLTLESLIEALSSPLKTAKDLTIFPNALDWCARKSFRAERHHLAKYQIWLDALRDIKGGEPGAPILSNALSQCELVTHSALGDRFMGLDADPHYFGIVLDRALSAETMKRITLTAIALKRYHLQKGHYPSSLSELTPAFLNSVPLDPMDSQPLRYRLESNGGYLLYSLGLDGTDEGGLGIRRPFRGSRRYPPSGDGSDLVWPQPATPEEVKALLAIQQAEKDKIKAMQDQTSKRPLKKSKD